MKTHSELSAFPPSGVEVRIIERFVQLAGRRILEVGCGDGRLTFQYASRASAVVAIDPDPDSIAAARRVRAVEGVRHAAFQVASGERLPMSGQPFDVALFSWSL